MDNKNKLREKTDIIIALIVMSLAAIFIFYKVFNTPCVIETENTQAKGQVLDGLSSDEKNTNTIDPNLKEKTNHTVGDIIPEEDSPSNITTKTDLIKIGNKANDTELISDETATQEEQKELLETEKSIEIEKTSQEVKESIKTKEKIVYKQTDTDCIIVIGAFKQELNKNKMIDKLTKLGYSHNKGLLSNGLIYVGVPVICKNKSEKRRLINELNKAFNVEAWIKKK